MGFPLTKLSDFEVGRFALPQSSITSKNLISIIGDVEEVELCNLLGFELSELLISDLDGTNTPVNQRFTKIFYKFFEKSSICSEKMVSAGIVDMLKGFVFFYYGRTLNVRLSMNGAITAESENAESRPANHSQLRANYNKSVKTFKAIQAYVKENEDIYPEFDGIEKDYLTII